jgi:hypothetical protein
LPSTEQKNLKNVSKSLGLTLLWANEITFLIDFWLLNTIPLEFGQKIQDGGDLRVGRFFLNLKNSKISSTFCIAK